MVSSNLVGPRISHFLETPDAQELNELFHRHLLCFAGTCANILSTFFVEMATNLPVTLVCDRASCLPRSPEKSGSSPQQSLPKLEGWKPCVIEWQKGKTLDRKPCLFLTWNWAVLQHFPSSSWETLEMTNSASKLGLPCTDFSRSGVNHGPMWCVWAPTTSKLGPMTPRDSNRQSHTSGCSFNYSPSNYVAAISVS